MNICSFQITVKGPKRSYTTVSDKMAYANSADPDKDQRGGGGVYTVCHSTKYFKKQLHKKQTLGQICLE